MASPRAKFTSEITRGVEDFGLTPKQSEFAVRYVKDKDTAGIKVRSALATYNTESVENARQMAYETLRKPHVQTYVQYLLENAGFGVEVRSAKLAEIGLGRIKTQKKLVQRNKAGEVVSEQEITSDVPASVQLKAITEANKMEGVHEKAQASVRLAEREYSELRKKLMKEAGIAD